MSNYCSSCKSRIISPAKKSGLTWVLYPHSIFHSTVRRKLKCKEDEVKTTQELVAYFGERKTSFGLPLNIFLLYF